MNQGLVNIESKANWGDFHKWVENGSGGLLLSWFSPNLPIHFQSLTAVPEASACLQTLWPNLHLTGHIGPSLIFLYGLSYAFLLHVDTPFLFLFLFLFLYQFIALYGRPHDGLHILTWGEQSMVLPPGHPSWHQHTSGTPAAPLTTLRPQWPTRLVSVCRCSPVSRSAHRCPTE